MTNAERNFFLILKLAGYGYLCYLFYFLAFAYDPAQASFRPPFVIFIVDTINLFIHEGGHFFTKPFGQTIYLAGGSLVQILLPLLLAIVSARQNYKHAVLPLFWTGESMVNVSVYIKDAPVRQLHLISRGAIHDWNWLLSDNMEAAEPLGDTVFVIGVLLCAAALGAGIWFAIHTYREAGLAHETSPVIPSRIGAQKWDE